VEVASEEVKRGGGSKEEHEPRGFRGESRPRAGLAVGARCGTKAREAIWSENLPTGRGLASTIYFSFLSRCVSVYLGRYPRYTISQMIYCSFKQA
jgi:hypothetical protein